MARRPSETTISRCLISVVALALTTFRKRVRARVFRSVSEPPGEDAVEGAGHESDLEVELDLAGHGGGQCIHVEEVDGIGDGVLDDHAARVSVDEDACRRVHLVGDEECALLVAEVGDGDLADFAGGSA